MRKQNAIIISDIKAIRKHVYMHYIVMMYVMHSSPLSSRSSAVTPVFLFTVCCEQAD